MRNLIKLLALLISINLFMYIGVNVAISTEGNQVNKDYKFYFKGDSLSYILAEPLDSNLESQKTNWTDYSLSLNSNWSTFPTESAGQEIGGNSGFSILDPLRIGYPFLKLLGNIALSPLTLFFNFSMPIYFGILIGVPYFVLFVVAIVAAIRGVGD